jgi:uncharacterized protein with von Willebrand factor type A (vWA) domain
MIGHGVKRKKRRKKMRVEALLPIAQFLGRAWSGKNVKVIIGSDTTIPKTFTNIIEIPPPSRYPVKGLVESYRLWRHSLWHEAMHQYFGIPTPKFLTPNSYLPNRTIIFNAVEDYRVEYYGVKEYPGMKREIEFSTAIYYSLANPPKSVVEMYVQLLLFNAVKGVNIIPKNVIDAVKYTINAIKGGVDSSTITETVCKMLNIRENDYNQYNIPMNYTANNKIKQKELEDKVKEWVKDKNEVNEEMERIEGGGRSKNEEGEGDSDEEVKVILSAGEDIEKEFEQIKAENERIERMRKEIASNVKVVLPSQLDVDESRFYDVELITHLKSQLQKLKKGWREIHSSSGEFDVESYVSKHSKIFIDEERLKVGGYKILVLVDHSGSIYGYHYDYKKACIALSEALSSLNIPFSVYCFNTFKEYVNVYLVKGFNEKWTRMNAKRLAQLDARGGTPLTEVYNTLKPIVDRVKGNLYFITLTDGLPNDRDSCREIIKKLKEKCRMYAVAISENMDNAVRLAENLKNLGYDRYVALDDVKKLPTKVLKLIFD